MNIKNHQSSVRKIVADSKSQIYTSFQDLVEAQKYKDSYLIVEGDYGGQIYLTFPVKKINCSEKSIANLLSDLDNLIWKDVDGARIFYEITQNKVVSGGMGSGLITDDLWVHEEFKNIKHEIKKVLNGDQLKINTN